MLRLISYAISLLLFCLSCSKKGQSERRIEGSWEVITYKQKNTEGITSYEAVEGFCRFNINHSFEIQLNKGNDQYKDSGIYEVTLTDYEGLRFNKNLEILCANEARIFMLTRTDLELEFYSNSGKIVGIILRKESD